VEAACKSINTCRHAERAPTVGCCTEMATASQLRHLHFDAAVLRRISDLLAKRAPRKLNGTPPRRAAVMMPLCNVDGHASCLFTKRSESVGTHKGQVSFPGGHLDNDETPIQAALREQVEELGDAMSGCEVLGQFDDALAGSSCARGVASGVCREVTVRRLNECPAWCMFMLSYSYRHTCHPSCRTPAR